MEENDIISKLQKLSSQRTARTDHLRAAVQRLLAQLAGVCEVGDRAVAGAWSLAREMRSSSNAGIKRCWLFEGPGTSCHLDAAGILPAERVDLLAFATRAQALVDDLVAGRARECEAIEGAIAAVENTKIAI